jgi:hypothetical protein
VSGDANKSASGNAGRILFLASLAVGAVVGWIGQPWIHDNERAINVIVTVFSILAGFLIAIMTIVGDPSAFGRRNWRSHEIQRSAVFQRLVRQKWLFVLYLVILGVIFAESLVSKAFPEATGLIVWMERVYLALAVTAFLLSLRLPDMLMKIQMERHDEAIEHKRSKPRQKKDEPAE